MRAPYLFAITLFIFLGAGCVFSPQDTHDGVSATKNDVHRISTLAGERILLDKIHSFTPGNITFSFILYGLDGDTLDKDDLAIVHEKRVHLLLVRDDLTGFQHLHPEYTHDRWTVTTVVRERGDYHLYVDIDPTRENPAVLRVPIRIGGATPTKIFPKPHDFSVTDDDYRAVLSMKNVPRVSEDTRLVYLLTKNGAAFATVDPYLGAYGHVILLGHNDPDDFFHVHAIAEKKPDNGRVEFIANFPKTGRYTLYAQFQLDGKVRTFPITLDVVEESVIKNNDNGGAMPMH